MPKGAPRNGPRGADEPGTGHGPSAARAAGSVEGAADAGGSHHEGSQQPPLVDVAGTAYEAAWIQAGKRPGKGRGGGGNSRSARTEPAATPVAPAPTPEAAPAMARSIVVRSATADLQRTTSAEHDYTVAAWAAKWSGMVRRRRNAAGYDVVDGW